MTIQTTPDVGVGGVEVARDAWQQRHWRVIGGLVVVMWVVALVGTVLLGERDADWDDLQGALRDGTVSQVEIAGMPYRGAGKSYSTVTLHWQGRVVHRYAEVISAASPKMARRAEAQSDLPVVIGDLAEAVHAIDPNVPITRTRWASSGNWTVWNWEAPGWIAITTMVAWLVGFGLLISGPEPWRATRWAWAWLVLFCGPLAISAFFLLGGPLGVGQPADRRRRITGGWGFLLMILLGGCSS